mmetsp:Transcript_70967/g.184212  ORF Transcript_70967/g.184212 Transcript_70967/m.184212 type:complete len:213 (-) Transcript_70967:176-814(-)
MCNSNALCQRSWHAKVSRIEVSTYHRCIHQKFSCADLHSVTALQCRLWSFSDAPGVTQHQGLPCPDGMTSQHSIGMVFGEAWPPSCSSELLTPDRCGSLRIHEGCDLPLRVCRQPMCCCKPLCNGAAPLVATEGQLLWRSPLVQWDVDQELRCRRGAKGARLRSTRARALLLQQGLRIEGRQSSEASVLHVLQYQISTTLWTKFREPCRTTN